jgi:hypothetical protein
MGPNSSGPSTSGAEREPECTFTVREFAGENPRLSSIDADRVRRWIVDSASDPSAPCAPLLARVSPEFGEGEGIPSEDEVRAFVRDLVRSSGAESLSWDVRHDGDQIRAHIITASLARRGWNAHKLFAVGSLAPRDVDQRFFRRAGMLSDSDATSDPRAARRLIYHPAAVVLMRIDGREAASFACPDNGQLRCALRVIDPSLRASRSSATTDDAMGLLTLRDWLRALRPLESDATRGVALEFARRAQFLPRVLRGVGEPVELVVTEAEQCPVDQDALASRRTALRASRHGVPTAGYRAVFAIRGSTVEIEGVDEPLTVRDATIARDLEAARARGALVSVTYSDADGVVQRVRVEEGTAPSVCLRAAVTLGD